MAPGEVGEAVAREESHDGGDARDVAGREDHKAAEGQEVGQPLRYGIDLAANSRLAVALPRGAGRRRSRGSSGAV
jgi:hypothetical protein